jgi:hypothetical protein
VLGEIACRGNAAVLTHLARQTEEHRNSRNYTIETFIWPEIGARIAAVPSKGHDCTGAEWWDRTQNNGLRCALKLAGDLQ